jgi:hypothetical protein
MLQLCNMPIVLEYSSNFVAFDYCTKPQFNIFPFLGFFINLFNCLILNRDRSGSSCLFLDFNFVLRLSQPRNMTIRCATSIDSGRRILILGESRWHHRHIVIIGGTLCQWLFLQIIFRRRNIANVVLAGPLALKNFRLFLL